MSGFNGSIKFSLAGGELCLGNDPIKTRNYHGRGKKIGQVAGRPIYQLAGSRRFNPKGLFDVLYEEDQALDSTDPVPVDKDANDTPAADTVTETFPFKHKQKDTCA